MEGGKGREGGREGVLGNKVFTCFMQNAKSCMCITVQKKSYYEGQLSYVEH